MWRNVRDLGAFIGVAIYAVSFGSLFRLVRKPEADLPPVNSAAAASAIKKTGRAALALLAINSPVLAIHNCCRDSPLGF